MKTPPVIVSVSGGKDSHLCYLLMLQRGRPFMPVMADTGHEHPVTMEHVAYMHERTGGPPVRIVRADFTERMARKRLYVDAVWREQGVPSSVCDQAIAVLHPTGIPFLDLCLWKGRFPSSRVRFCTQELKVRPIEEQVQVPALEAHGRCVVVTGERADESAPRARLPRLQRVRWRDPAGTMVRYRPLLTMTADDVIGAIRQFGDEPNPLYRLGMNRVGCMPCIMARKAELRVIAQRWPEEVARVEEWEALAAQASKRGAATFFGPDRTPEGAAMAERGATSDYPGVRQVMEWARTARGGRQYDLLNDMPPGECASEYGLCE